MAINLPGVFSWLSAEQFAHSAFAEVHMLQIQAEQD
jgi:hypothetical protein